MRVTTVFKRLMDLPGVTVTDVDFQPTTVVVTVKLRSRKLRCPACEFTTHARYDTRPVSSSWRHLDLGRWRLEVRATLRRIDCPTHGARTEGVPFARSGSVHPGLREPGRLVGDHHGQDRAVSPGAHRLGHDRADHRAGRGDRA